MDRREVDISVVVPFYNAGDYIENCINALLSQDYPAHRYEVILIDNNSTDGSTEIARRHPGVQLLSETTQGAYAARNRGALEARGGVIAFTDPDCLPDRVWLREIMDAMRDGEVGIVLGKRDYASHTLPLSLLAAYENGKIAYVCGGNDRHLYYGFTNNLAVRRDAFDRCGPFLEVARGADAVFVRRVVDEYGCGAVRYSPQVSVRHLEIQGIGDYYRKRFIYGKSYKKYREVGAARALSYTERIRVLKRTVQENGYSLPESLLLSLLLFIGSLHYDLGRLIPR